MRLCRAKRLYSFNPHTHAGCDVTLRKFPSLSFGFNPHTHAGCDCTSVSFANLSGCFNPHTHAGCDFSEGRALKGHISFNPHTHAGCDIYKRLENIGLIVSIHTPTQGVTTFSGRCRDKKKKFQSTHPRRVWLFNNAAKMEEMSFNPHTHAGCDVQTPTVLWFWLSFNPHTHAGCDWI